MQPEGTCDSCRNWYGRATPRFPTVQVASGGAPIVDVSWVCRGSPVYIREDTRSHDHPRRGGGPHRVVPGAVPAGGGRGSGLPRRGGGRAGGFGSDCGGQPAVVVSPLKRSQAPKASGWVPVASHQSSKGVVKCSGSATAVAVATAARVAS